MAARISCFPYVRSIVELPQFSRTKDGRQGLWVDRSEVKVTGLMAMLRKKPLETGGSLVVVWLGKNIAIQLQNVRRCFFVQSRERRARTCHRLFANRRPQNLRRGSAKSVRLSSLSRDFASSIRPRDGAAVGVILVTRSMNPNEGKHSQSARIARSCEAILRPLQEVQIES